MCSFWGKMDKRQLWISLLFSIIILISFSYKTEMDWQSIYNLNVVNFSKVEKWINAQFLKNTNDTLAFAHRSNVCTWNTLRGLYKQTAYFPGTGGHWEFSQKGFPFDNYCRTG